MIRIEIEVATLDDVLDALKGIEQIYNLVWHLYAPLWEGSIMPGFAETLRRSQTMGLPRGDDQLRKRIPPDDWLRIVSLTPASSIRVSFEGVAEVLRTLLDLFNPIDWMQKWENLKHARAMNQIERKKAEHDLWIKQVESISRIGEACQDLIAELGEDVGREHCEALRFELARRLEAQQRQALVKTAA